MIHLYTQLLCLLKQGIKIRVAMGGEYPGLIFALGKWYEKQGNYPKAIRYYQAGLYVVESRDTGVFFRCRQYWQYALEHAHHLAGRTRVFDPLFHCETRPVRSTIKTNSGASAPIGAFEAGWTHHGLRLDGFVLHKDVSRVEIMLENRMICSMPVRRRRFVPGYFNFQIKREVIRLFPEKSIVKVRLPSGGFLEWKGLDAAYVRVPHGTDEIREQLDQGAVINKKGYFVPTSEAVKIRQSRYLAIYERANRFFEERFQKSLFLMYGTLLGYYREGDFISRDDDFDAGYVSHQRDVQAVKAEAKCLVVELVLAGFTVSFNRSGRLFRLRLGENHPHEHLDLRPVWYEEGYVWAHLQACLPLRLDDFLPVRKGWLRGTAVNIPHDAEAFLKAYYGPGWKVPDPGYSNASKRPSDFVRKKLALLCIRPSEYREMLEEIETRRALYPEAGKLIAIGSHSLYPLNEYEASCGL